VLLVIALGLAAPAAAAAHFKTGTVSTDFEARVGGFDPPEPGVRARVLDGDLRLELRVASPQVVVVLGYEGEPFLRFSVAGVDANLASPTAVSTRVIKATDALVRSGVRWRRVSRGHVFAWHENRLRPVPLVGDQSTRARAVGSWMIPLLVDGRRASLVGTEWYAAGPSLWPWLVAGALLVALAGLGARLLSRRMHLLISSVLLPVAVGALLAELFGIFLAGRVTFVLVLFAIVFAGVTSFFLLAVVAVASGTARLGVLALIGALTATFALPELAVFGHGFVLSALPAVVARLGVAISLGGGTIVAIVCLPAVIELFEVVPAREL
jgi:hypothetical protein